MRCNGGGERDRRPSARAKEVGERVEEVDEGEQVSSFQHNLRLASQDRTFPRTCFLPYRLRSFAVSVKNLAPAARIPLACARAAPLAPLLRRVE